MSSIITQSDTLNLLDTVFGLKYLVLLLVVTVT